MPDTLSPDLLDPAHLARLDNYELMARLAVEGYLAGLHRSISHGFGMEFLQYRVLSPGEDLRFVDWKVYARTDRLYARVYREETNLDLHLVLDVSASMGYQGSTAVCSKMAYASRMAACLAYLAHRQGDRPGLLAYAGDLITVLPPGSRGARLPALMQHLSVLQPAGRADHARAERHLEIHARRRSLIVWITDAQEAEEELPARLGRLRLRHADALALQVLDPDEMSLPETPAARFIDLETGRETITNPEATRAYFKERRAACQDLLQAGWSSAGVDAATVLTRDSLGLALASFLHHRRRHF